MVNYTADAPKDSVDAMILEATRQGWLPDRDFGFIPELVSIYKNAAEYFIEIIANAEPRMRETLVYHTCRYLFAKGVEGVILWGISSDGKISINFHAKHLAGDVEIEVPSHLRNIVTESMTVGESLFKAHQGFVMRCQKGEMAIDFSDEIDKTIEAISRFGISYALFHKYHELR